MAIDVETMETVTDFIFRGSKITADGDCRHEIKRHLLLGRKAMKNLDSILKSRDIALSTEVVIVKAMIFPVHIWELDHKEGCLPKNWCFWTVLLDKTLESSLDSKEIKLVNPEGHQPWLFIGRTHAEAETPLLGPLTQRTGSLEKKNPDARKDWGQEEKGKQRMRWLDGIANSMNTSLSKL